MATRNSEGNSRPDSDIAELFELMSNICDLSTHWKLIGVL